MPYITYVRNYILRKMVKINEVNMGFAGGIVSAAAMLVLSVGSRIGMYSDASNMMMQMHMFYSPSILGTITGMIEAGVVGFIFGYLLILVYNKLEN